MLASHIAEALRGSPHRIMVTGASGWLGSATLDLLHDALGEQFHDRVVCFGSSARTLRLADGDTIEQRSLNAMVGLPAEPSLLLHLAFLTKERAEQMDETGYRAANRAIRQAVLDALDPAGVEAVFLASSGAAAFADDPATSAAMRLYGSLKREDETAFADWAEGKGRSLISARIFNISGAHINKLGSYALASFIIDALAGGPVRIKAPHDVLRSYVAVRELMSLVFALLLAGDPGVLRFDSGGDPVELGALAEGVAARFGGCAVERPQRAPGEDRYLGDGGRYRQLLEQHGIEAVSLACQIEETADYLMRMQTGLSAGAMAAGVAS